MEKGRMTRIEFLKKTSFISILLLTGCSEIQYLTGSYPDKYKEDGVIKDQILRSFVATVIPEVNKKCENITRIFNDEYYPFKSYCSFFVSDLSSRALRLFDTEKFHLLDLEKRTLIVEDGLRSSQMLKRLYSAAIFMSQVSYYSSIYDPDAGCELISFPGTNNGYDNSVICYSDAKNHLASELTLTGNYN